MEYICECGKEMAIKMKEDETKINFYPCVNCTEYDSGHRNGYNEGYNEGYDEGYEEGFEEGYDKGCTVIDEKRHREPAMDE